MNSKIYILSQPVHSGKTTLLMNWTGRQRQVGGILTPDVGGRRKLYDIAEGTYHDLETDHAAAEDIIIGKYIFSRTAFEQAQQILLKGIDQHYDWIVADEIGRLEMEHKSGLEPAVSSLISHFFTRNIPGRLLLVIRDYLLEQAIKHYGLQEAAIIQHGFFDE